MIIGVCDLSFCDLISLHKSRPDPSGNMRSNKIKENSDELNCSLPSSNVDAQTTS